MKNRRILTHPELEPNQIRAVDAFSKFNSDIVNNLTKISHKVDEPDIVIDGLDVIENCADNVEYLSQELINYNKFTVSDHCHKVSDELQIYVSDDDVDGIKYGYITQDLSDNEFLDIKRYFGSNVTKTFLVSFTLSNGTPKNLFLKIGESVLDLKYLDGAYDDKTNRYTVALDVNFKNISRALTIKLGAHIDILDYRNFYSRDEQLSVSFLTISNVSCKMVIRDKSRDVPFYCDQSDWDINNTHYVKSLRIGEGTAVKDNVVLTCLRSVNVGNSAVVLPLNDEKSWIHNDPYTAHEFCDKSEFYDIKMQVEGNNNLEWLSGTINENQDLVAFVRNNNSNEIRQLPLTDYNSISDVEIEIYDTVESGDYIIVQTKAKYITNQFCGNTLIVTSKGKVITKLDTILTQETCPSVTFKVLKKDVTSVNDLKIWLSNVPVKVVKETKHTLWAYVVCYYSYYKNPNPNACYLGLIREEDYLKEGYTEDYLTLAKVRFVDPHTIDLIQYLDNRNNYSIPTARDINYIVTFNYPDIWYTKNPVTLADAINYCEVLRVNVLKRYKLKHDLNEPNDTGFRILNTDGKIDKKGRISVDLQATHQNSLYHLQRRIAPNTRLIKIINIFETGGIIDLDPETVFNWDILRSKWITPDEKWAISDDFSRFGLFDKYANDISNLYLGFNSYSPFKFMNPRTGETAIEFDWDFSTLKNAYIPQNDQLNEDYTRFDLAKDDSYFLSYYPPMEGENDPLYIKPIGDTEEVLNSQHNHFSYVQFRNQLLSRKYMIKMLDMLPTFDEYSQQYLIDGRILTCLNGHIKSTIHQIESKYDDKTLVNAEVFADYDIIKSTTYVMPDRTIQYIISTNNFKTRGDKATPFVPKLLQENQLIIYGKYEGVAEIQSSNYIIDDLVLGYILISETDNRGMIHIKSSNTRYSSGNMTDKNTVIGRVYPEYQEIDTDKYYLNTNNFRTRGDKKSASEAKFFQDQQLLLANTDSDKRTSIESSNIIIDETLKNNHIVLDEVDENVIIHLKSSKNQISNSMANGNLVTADNVTDTNATVNTTKYDISLTNHHTKGDTDKPLQTEHILTCYPGTGLNKSIESSNVIIDVTNTTDSDNHFYIKITETDANGVVHLKNSDKVIDEFKYDLCYLPSNIKIKDGKVHLTIDCLKKFRVTSSQILKAIQEDPGYASVFNYDIDTAHPVLFNLVVHFDLQDISDVIDREKSNDGSFKTTANTYESEILFINDIGLSEVRRHVVTEQERDHVVMEEDSDKHLVLENDSSSKFRSCVAVEYIVTNGAEVLSNQIQWVDELRGYNNKIEEDILDPDRPHVTGEAENVDYVFSVYDVFPTLSDDPTIDLTDADDFDEEEFDDEDDIMLPDEAISLTKRKFDDTEDIEEVGDVEDVDKIEFTSIDVDKTTTVNIDVGDFEVEDIDKSAYVTEDASSGYDADDVDTKIETFDDTATNVSLHRLHEAANILQDLSSFLSLYPCILEDQRWARVLRSDNGWGDARGPMEAIFAQTKARIIFNVVKNNTETIPDLIPGITFRSVEDKTIYAYSETYNIE